MLLLKRRDRGIRGVILEYIELSKLGKVLGIKVRPALYYASYAGKHREDEFRVRVRCSYNMPQLID